MHTSCYNRIACVASCSDAIVGDVPPVSRASAEAVAEAQADFAFGLLAAVARVLDAIRVWLDVRRLKACSQADAPAAVPAYFPAGAEADSRWKESA